MKTWSKYFTPADIARQLVGKIQLDFSPTSAADICAGSGNLLRAVSKRWPRARLVGNDLHREQAPANVHEWSTRDGRLFALMECRRGVQYDLVVANPPFGRTSGLRVSLEASKHVALIRSARIEIGMTVAASHLVSDRGVLATVMPETLLVGESFAALRHTLVDRFCCFEFERIERGDFGGEDLGLVMLVCYRKHRGRCRGTLPGRAESSMTSRYSTVRGCIVASSLNARGGRVAAHCVGTRSGGAYTLRKLKRDAYPRSTGQLLVRGDVVVSRVGRGAGRVGVFMGPPGTAFTDCVYRLRMNSKADRAALLQLVREGSLERALMRRCRGLAAQYITKLDVDRALSELIV